MNTLVSIIAVGLLIALHEAGHFAAAVRVGMTVRKYSIGLLRSVVSWTSKKSGIVYQIGILPLGGFVEIKGMNPFEEDAYTATDSYQNKSAWRRAIVLLAGPGANLLIAWVIFFGLAVGAGLPVDVDKSGVGAVVADGAADKAGLEPDDQIVVLNGESLKTWRDLTSRLEVNPGKEISLEVLRDGERLTINITPEDRDGVGKIGIYRPKEFVRSSPLDSAIIAALKIYQLGTGTFAALAMKISGDEAAKDLETVGPLGIVRMAASALNSGFREFLGLMAYLSTMLFLFNLLPIPALDGGRGLFLLIEVISRKKIKPKTEAMVNTVGFFLLIGLLLYVTGGEVWEMISAKGAGN